MYRTALVTGSSGFIGAHLCRRLAGLGVEVHTVSREDRPPAGSARSWKADLRDAAEAVEIVQAAAPEVIFHLAGYATGRRGIEHVLPACAGNLLTTVNVLQAATAARCARVLIAGSLEEPDEHGADAICTSPYAASRLAATIYARMFHRLYGTPVVATRIAMVYGPGPQNPAKLVPDVIRNFLSDRSPKLMSGNREADWIYVDDAIDALLACSLAPGIEGEVIEIGSGRLTTTREIVERLRVLTGGGARPEYGALPDRCFETSRVADVASTEARVGWHPLVPLEEGLARTVEWFRRESLQSDAGYSHVGAHSQGYARGQ
jgi:nucleoside-diphosphate-sugar epimerase